MRIGQFPALFVVMLLCSASLASAQVLETETARQLPARSATLGTGYEHQTSTEGQESTVPMAFELGLTNRLGLLFEPVVRTSIQPNQGPHADGVGDLEITATYLLRAETGRFPALGVAGEVKIPTAESFLIGTDQTDYAGYLILSRRRGRFDTHANLGYTIVGQPAGSELSNIWNAALASEFFVNHRWELFAEVLGNTSSVPTSGREGANGTTSPEASGGEFVGTFGAALNPSRAFQLSLSMSYDNNQALLIRPGMSWKFPLPGSR